MRAAAAGARRPRARQTTAARQTRAQRARRPPRRPPHAPAAHTRAAAAQALSLVDRVATSLADEVLLRGCLAGGLGATLVSFAQAAGADAPPQLLWLRALGLATPGAAAGAAAALLLAASAATYESKARAAARFVRLGALEVDPLFEAFSGDEPAWLIRVRRAAPLGGARGAAPEAAAAARARGGGGGGGGGGAAGAEGAAPEVGVAAMREALGASLYMYSTFGTPKVEVEVDVKAAPGRGGGGEGGGEGEGGGKEATVTTTFSLGPAKIVVESSGVVDAGGGAPGGGGGGGGGAGGALPALLEAFAGAGAALGGGFASLDEAGRRRRVVEAVRYNSAAGILTPEDVRARMGVRMCNTRACSSCLLRLRAPRPARAARTGARTREHARTPRQPANPPGHRDTHHGHVLLSAGCSLLRHLRRDRRQPRGRGGVRRAGRAGRGGARGRGRGARDGARARRGQHCGAAVTCSCVTSHSPGPPLLGLG